MINENHNDIIAIIFSQSQEERDYLRAQLNGRSATAVFFENEAICFENLKTIKPDYLIVQTDAIQVVWRFIFAVHAYKADTILIIISDVLKRAHFGIAGRQNGLCCVSRTGLAATLGNASKAKDHRIERSYWRHEIPLFIGESEHVQSIRGMLGRLGDSLDPILITGEPGTGKEHLAKLIVSMPGPETKFIKISCRDLMRQAPCPVLKMAEFDLFLETISNASHKKAQSTMVAVLFHGIHHLNKDIQAELLMLMDEAKATAQDDSWPQIKFIATTQINLDHLVASGNFRKELYYRLNVIPIILPPLRHRKQDIPLLVDYFMMEQCAKHDKNFFFLAPETMERIYLSDWPGNVDELSRLIRRIASSGDESVVFISERHADRGNKVKKHLPRLMDMDALPDKIEIEKHLSNLKSMDLRAICDQFVAKTEKRLMKKALNKTNWNRKKAAKLLNISYKSMLNKMKAYDII